MKRYSNILAIILLVASIFLAGFISGHRRATRGQQGGMKVKVDTVVRYVTRSGRDALVDRVEFDHWDVTLPALPSVIPVHDTVPQLVTVHDSVYIYVPIRDYKFDLDSGRVRIWAKGYDVDLYRWEVDEKETLVTKTIRRRWGFSVAAGPGVFVDVRGRMHTGGGVVAGVSYTF